MLNVPLTEIFLITVDDLGSIQNRVNIPLDEDLHILLGLLKQNFASKAMFLIKGKVKRCLN